MPIQVNGEIIPVELLREEERSLLQLPDWQSIPDGLEKGMRLRQAAEERVIDRILLRQEADKDLRPIDPALIAAHVQQASTSQTCRVLFDDGPISREIEGQLRIERTMRDLMGPPPEPPEDEIERLYKAGRENFLLPETVEAAHIVKHVDETHPEPDAHAGIQAAQAALQNGEPFAEVAERYSDCKGNGGDLGSFPRGAMVEEFDNVVFTLQPGERSPVFRTPFGFHIAEVRAKSPARVAEFAEARETIRHFLISAHQREVARGVAQRLRAQAHIRRVSTRAAAAPAPQRVAG